MSKVIVIGHKSPDTDSIAAAISYSNLKRELGMDAAAYRAGELNKESKFALDYFGVEAPEFIDHVEAGQQVILVDHNESKQCVDGIKDAEVIELVDHHRIGDFETASPIFILFCPVGCVNTIIYNLYKLNNVKPSRAMAGMMLSAIISDTVCSVPRLPRIRIAKQLRNWLNWLELITKNTAWKCLRLVLIFDYPAEKLAENDTKEFESAGKVFTVGQISVMDVEPINAKS